MFLSEQEIQRLTGKKRYSAQIRWLREHGYKVTPNGLGQPVVSIAEATRKTTGGTVASREEGPRWEVLSGQAT